MASVDAIYRRLKKGSLTDEDLRDPNFARAARRYALKHGKTVVVSIDNLSRLQKDKRADPQELEVARRNVRRMIEEWQGNRHMMPLPFPSVRTRRDIGE